MANQKTIDLIEYIKKHKTWSEKVFGKEIRTEGILKHIEKEIKEIRSEPNDLYEWIDLIILAIDGLVNLGFSPLDIARSLVQKQNVNIDERQWPEFKSGNEPIEHIKS